jgi:tellurite resistance-related uncharacterized protein
MFRTAPPPLKILAAIVAVSLSVHFFPAMSFMLDNPSGLTASGSWRRRFAYTARHAMKDLPNGVVKYSQVPKTGGAFSAADNNIPKGLLKNHSTKDGTWGVIRVLQGKLQYQINGNDDIENTDEIIELDVDTVGIIEPTVFHQVAPLTDDVEFVVEFHRLPNTGPVDEQREGL